MKGCGSLHLTIALCVADLTEQCRYCGVRFKLGHDTTHECLQGAVVHIEIEVRRARGLVRAELCISGQSAHILLIAYARASSHVLQRVLNTDDGQHEEVLAVLGCRFLELLRSKLKFSCHDDE